MGGLLSELSRKVRKAVEAGGFGRKSRGLNRSVAGKTDDSGISGLSFSALRCLGDSGHSTYTCLLHPDGCVTAFLCPSYRLNYLKEIRKHLVTG